MAGRTSSGPSRTGLRPRREPDPPVAGLSPPLPAGNLIAAVRPETGSPALLPAAVFNPMLSVGHQLAQARQARSLTIEDAAFETRIPHQRLREMENDDLSNFANLTYAKGFLKLYSRFLRLDLSEYLDEFDTSAVAEATGHAYARLRFTRSETLPVMTTEAPRSRGSLLGVGLILAIAAGGAWLFFKDRIGQPSPASPPPAQTTPAPEAKSSGPVPNPDQLPAVPAPPAGSPAPVEREVPRAAPVDNEGNGIPPRAEPAE